MKPKFIKYIISHPYKVLSFSLFLTIFFILGLKWFVFDDDFVSLLPKDIKSRQILMEIEDEFGASEVIIIGVGNQNVSIYTNKLLSKVYDLTQEIEQIPLVDEVISIATLNKITSDDGFMEVSELMESNNPSREEIIEIKSYLNSDTTLSSRINSKNGEYTSIIIRPKDDINNAMLVEKIIPLTNVIFDDYEIYYAGQSYITGIIPELIQNDVRILMAIGLIIMLLILFLNLRNAYSVLLIMFTIILSMLSMFGFMGWMFYMTGMKYFNFTMLNTSMPIVLLTIANSDGVHMLSRFFKEMRRKEDVKKAIYTTLDSLSLPIFLTSLTTSIAFLAMFISPIDQMMGYGISMAFGISWAWILSITLIPSLILAKKWDLDTKAINKRSFLEKSVTKIKNVIQTHPRRILSFGLLIVMVSSIGLFYITIEVNTTKFFKPGHPIRESADFVDSKLMGSMNLLVKAQGDIKSPATLNQIDKLQNYLSSKEKVNLSISITNIIKQMHKSVMDDDPTFETIPENREKINNLFTMYSMSGDPDDFSSLVNYNYDTALITSMMHSISTTETVEMVTDVENWIQLNLNDKIDIQISGMAVFFRDFVNLVIESSFISILVSIIIIFFIAWFYLKSHILGILAIIPLSSSVLINFGLMGLFGIELSHITALLTAIIIGVGVDFAIHYLSEFKRNANKLDSLISVNDKTIDDVGYPILLDVASNMGFIALLFSAVVPLNYMGGLMVFAMISTSIATLTLMASIIELNKEKILKDLIFYD